MPSYLAPGVYVEEVDTGIPAIEGVSTSITGFVGVTRRGPTSGLPVLVTSFMDFQRSFGGYFDFGPSFLGLNYLPYAVEGFFQNGGQLLYLMRVAATDGSATAASTTAQGGLVTTLRNDTVAAAGPPADVIYPSTLRGLQVGTTLQLRMIKNGVTTQSGVLTVKSINRATGAVTLTTVVSPTAVYEARYTTVFTNVDSIDGAGNITALGTPLDPRPNTFSLQASSVGSWGRSLVIQATHQSAAQAQFSAFVSGAAGNNQIQMVSTAGFYTAAWVEIDQGNNKHYRQVVAVNGPILTLDGPAMAAGDFAPQAPATATILSTCEFRLAITYQDPSPLTGPVFEQFSGLTLANVPGRYYRDIINNGSNLIRITGVDPAQTHPFLYPSGGDGLNVALTTGGADGNPPTDLDIRGTDPGPGQRTGLKALEDIETISIIAVPGITSQVVQNALVEQCERLKYRFGLLDPHPKAGNLAPDINDIQNQRNLYDTKYAAIYYPRVMMPDPTNVIVPVPPSGHMAGIYARVDDERGVYKAPANEVIADITGLELTVNKAEQDILNPEPDNINVLRDFRRQGRGLRVWGARCITGDTTWKYINVRRLFIFLEASLDVGTQWVVFEPNDERLWARVTQSVSEFLTRVWRNGALMGTTAEEAFFVTCDRTTMTQDDIDNGRLIMIIGVAPVKPAEYVIIRIGQWTGGSSAAEF